MALFDRLKKLDANKENIAESVRKGSDMLETATSVLTDVSEALSKAEAVGLPIAGLGTLGGSIASILPTLRKVSDTVGQGSDVICRCIFSEEVSRTPAGNKGAKTDTPAKKAGAAESAKRVKEKAKTVDLSSFASVNPATLMMAAALMAIDQKLDDVIDMEKQILSFLEEDKEAKIEGDLKTLSTIIREYKFNWDNATYIATHHQIAADIKRDSEANMIFYQKQIAETLKSNTAILLQQFIEKTQAALIKKFKYYRLSLYLYGFASFIEVMLQGQYEEGYLLQIRQNIIDRTDEYRKTYDSCIQHLEKMTSSSIEHNVLKTIGSAGKSFGNLLGGIQAAKGSQVNEWFTKNGESIKQSGEEYGRDALKQFETVKDPGCDVFIDNITQINRLFNETQEIYIDSENIYLV